MREAIDYNALSWVRQELAETLKQARHQLEEYGGSRNRESLQGCVARLHEARGPLQMVDLKGADLLTGEMEEVLADLLLDTIDEPDTALELLMQGFLELPEYLYSLRSGRPDRPTALFPLVNSLRAQRGEQPLEEEAVFSPNLSVRVPATVFDIRAEHPRRDVTAMARAARLKFQSGLLGWYRNAGSTEGLQTLVNVLDHLVEQAGSEAAARLWWVAAGVAELLRDGELQSSPDIKRLFGRIDRHIKRLMDKGEAVFSDVLTDDLLRNLLFQISNVSAESARIAEIRATYGLGDAVAEPGSGNDDSVTIAACSEELLQTVSATVQENIVRIKEQLDGFLQGGRSGLDILAGVADDLHALANMLGMIGMERLGEVISGKEQLLRDCVEGTCEIGEKEFTGLADTLVATEDALADITASIDGRQTDTSRDDVTFRQGQEAVVGAIIDDMASAKEAINEFLHSCGDFDLLADVPVILNRIHGSLQLVGQARVAAATGMVRTFVSRELVAAHRELSEEDLDTLADAICSIEYCVEELAENRDFGHRAMDIAEESLEKLGYAVPEPGPADTAESDSQEAVTGASAAQADPATADDAPAAMRQPDTAPADDDVTALPAIGADADPEIVEIFIEEAAEELEKITALVPAWCDDPVNQDVLTEIRRSFHTLKGSGRMVGALATGEFSWAVENLVNNLLDGTVDIDQQILELLRRVPAALSGLLEQVGNPDCVIPAADINSLARQAHASSKPDTIMPAPLDDEGMELPAAGEPDALPDDGQTAVEQAPLVVAADFPVLVDGADPEIVEIFLEEAGEAFEAISVTIPAWVTRPEDPELMAGLRRNFHTLKGSGRMAGAMRVGEFGWVIESLFNRLADGVIQQSAGLFTLMVGVPEALAQLLEQVRDGTEPAVDIQEILEQATRLANGEQLVVASGTADEETADGDDSSIDAGVVDDYPVQEDEPSLVEIFSNEAHEHLQTVNAWLGSYEEPGEVTDALYRALHTLTGIAESAGVPAVSRLADGLYAWFGALYEEHQPVCAEGHGVLRDSAAEIVRMVDALPEELCDEAVLAPLCERIAALPPIENISEAAGGMPATDSAAGAGETPPPADESTNTETCSPVAEPASEPYAVADEPVEQASAPEAVGEDTEEDTVDAETASAATAPAGDAETVADAPVEQDPYADMDPELYGIFIEEAAEIMDASEAVLRAWSDEPDNRELMAEFQRHLHTLKGSARMVDLGTIGDLSHAVESVITELADDRIQGSPELFALLADTHDRLAEMLDQVRNRKPAVNAPDLEARLNAMIGISVEPGSVPVPEPESLSATGAVPEPEIVEPAEDVRVPEPAEERAEADEAEAVAGNGPAPVVEVAAVARPASPAGRTARRASPPRLVVDQEQTPHGRSEQVKVAADMLDNMVNHAGEINIYRSRMEQQISDYRFNLSELDQTINRLRDQLRQLEMETEAQILYRYEQESEQAHPDFDPLEMDRYSTLQQLSRSLMESISDLRSLHALMENTTRDSETLLLQQSRISTELQENLIHTRMIPFASLSPRLRRIARQAARQLDKKVDVQLSGEDGEMDRAVVERIVAPLEHMLRNSVAHGIELPRERKAAGKPVTGRIDIGFERDGSEIVLRIADDGAGMNIDAIRERAIERGLMKADSGLPDQDVLQFVLQTGFSTASEVTQLSGRGVGMDVVNSEVKQLGGSLHIESEAGKGAVFTVRLPYTLAINQAMLVTAGDETFCIPLASVEGVVRFYPDELRECYGDGQQLFEYGGNEYRLKHLASLLKTGAMTLPGDREQVPVLLVRVGDKRVGFHVESLQGIREVVIKPVGPQLSLVDGISGATILGDGRVVMILDMVAVSRREVSMEAAGDTVQSAQTDDRLVVMVVDDSITVRKVTTRLLERNGYRVVTAKDGVDAMGKLQESIPDIMLLDIEMPRMDGFELASHMRNDDSFRHVPIIMITSRTGDKHRERASQIGIQYYLGKPYQESDLLESIHGIIGVDTAAAGT